MDNSEDGSRRTKRTVKPVTLFSFPPDHRTAATRINESRERGRVLIAVRKNRGLSPPGNTNRLGIPGKKQVGEKKAVKMQDGEEPIEEEEDGGGQDGEQQDGDEQDGEEQLELEETWEDRTGQELNKSSKRKAKSSLIVKFSWNKN